MSYIVSNKIKVFPGSFRGSNRPNATKTTETNIRELRILSNNKNNTNRVEKVFDSNNARRDDAIKLYINGYYFYIDDANHSSGDGGFYDLVQTTENLWAYIKVRSVEVKDITTQAVVDQVDYLDNIERTSGQTNYVLDNIISGVERFTGLCFSAGEPQVDEKYKVQITSTAGTIVYKEYKYDSSEIRNVSTTVADQVAINDIFNTNTLNATNVNATNVNATNVNISDITLSKDSDVLKISDNVNINDVIKTTNNSVLLNQPVTASDTINGITVESTANDFTIKKDSTKSIKIANVVDVAGAVDIDASLTVAAQTNIQAATTISKPLTITNPLTVQQVSGNNAGGVTLKTNATSGNNAVVKLKEGTLDLPIDSTNNKSLLSQSTAGTSGWVSYDENNTANTIVKRDGNDIKTSTLNGVTLEKEIIDNKDVLKTIKSITVENDTTATIGSYLASKFIVTSTGEIQSTALTNQETAVNKINASFIDNANIDDVVLNNSNIKDSTTDTVELANVNADNASINEGGTGLLTIQLSSTQANPSTLILDNTTDNTLHLPHDISEEGSFTWIQTKDTSNLTNSWVKLSTSNEDTNSIVIRDNSGDVALKGTFNTYNVNAAAAKGVATAINATSEDLAMSKTIYNYIDGYKATKVGTITEGVWQGTKVGNSYIAERLTGKRYNGINIINETTNKDTTLKLNENLSLVSDSGKYRLDLTTNAATVNRTSIIIPRNNDTGNDTVIYLSDFDSSHAGFVPTAPTSEPSSKYLNGNGDWTSPLDNVDLGKTNVASYITSSETSLNYYLVGSLDIGLVTNLYRTDANSYRRIYYRQEKRTDNEWHTTLYAPSFIASETIQAATFDVTSDIRKKENVIDYTPEKSILDLQVKKFDFIDGPKNQIGCIAQDLKEICPEIVNEDADGYLSIQESKLVYLLLDEVKKLKEEVKKLQK